MRNSLTRQKTPPLPERPLNQSISMSDALLQQKGDWRQCRGMNRRLETDDKTLRRGEEKQRYNNNRFTHWQISVGLGWLGLRIPDDAIRSKVTEETARDVIILILLYILLWPNDLNSSPAWLSLDPPSLFSSSMWSLPDNELTWFLLLFFNPIEILQEDYC